MAPAARWMVVAATVVAALLIGIGIFTELGGPGSSSRQLEDLAESLPEPEPDARLVSNEVGAS
ncbi:MAG: hypothetical protein WD602_00835, partial [Actinomycetota bacterium]